MGDESMEKMHKCSCELILKALDTGNDDLLRDFEDGISKIV